MQKWEHKRFVCDSDTAADEALTKMGDEGWELVAATDTGKGVTMFFKRPLVAEDKPGWVMSG